MTNRQTAYLIIAIFLAAKLVSKSDYSPRWGDLVNRAETLWRWLNNGETLNQEDFI